MKFVLVNGRAPRPKSFCALCCEPIAESYLRDLSTRSSYCDQACYLGHCQLAASAQATREGLMRMIRLTHPSVPFTPRCVRS
jgi:hypothetical protein